MPIINSQFKPAWWLKNSHLQTIWGTKFKQPTELDLISQRIQLDDGASLDVLRTPKIEDKPIVVILHGLEGSVESHYVKSLIKQLTHENYAAYFMHFRGCSENASTQTKGYSANDSKDLQALINSLKDKHQRYPFAVIGFSLGGSVVLKWLGENAENADTCVGIAVSVPFRLKDAAIKLEKGFSRIYQNHLLTICRNKYKKNTSKEVSSLDVDIKNVNTFYQFDDQITAPLHGFNNAENYYNKCSSRQFLKKIRKTTLVLHAKDDPFMWEDTIPTEEELSDNVYLELSKQGGHVGFISAGETPWKISYWLEKRIVKWLNQQRQLLK